MGKYDLQQLGGIWLTPNEKPDIPLFYKRTCTIWSQKGIAVGESHEIGFFYCSPHLDYWQDGWQYMHRMEFVPEFVPLVSCVQGNHHHEAGVHAHKETHAFTFAKNQLGHL